MQVGFIFYGSSEWTHSLQNVKVNNLLSTTLGHFIFRWNQILKPWFETKIKPRHKVTIKLWFQTKFKTKLAAKTKVLNQSFGFKPKFNLNSV